MAPFNSTTSLITNNHTNNATTPFVNHFNLNVANPSAWSTVITSTVFGLIAFTVAILGLLQAVHNSGSWFWHSSRGPNSSQSAAEGSDGTELQASDSSQHLSGLEAGFVRAFTGSTLGSELEPAEDARNESDQQV